MSVSITLQFASYAEAAGALSRLAQYPATTGVISPEDRPDAGLAVPLPPAAPVLDAVLGRLVAPPAVEFNPFGGAAVPVVPPLPPAAAPVPPVASLPTAATAPTAASSPTVDSTGLPWDARIHAANKGTRQDGSWRAKKGLNDEAAVRKIEAELRAAVQAPAAPAAILPPPPAAIAPPPPVVAPAAPPPPVVAPVLQAVQPSAFGAFMAKLAPLFASNREAANARMDQALAVVGLSAISQLAARADLIPTVEETFNALAPAAA